MITINIGLSTPNLADPLTKSVYTLSDDAKQEFIAIHDELNSCIREEYKFNHNHRSILSKGQGQLLRITAAHWSIEQALVRIEEKKCGAVFLNTSMFVLKQYIAQKFAFDVQLLHHNDNPDGYDHHRLRRIMELPPQIITPSMISQTHISTPDHWKISSRRSS